MDQGIIENLKVHYRRFLLRERLSAIDENKEYKLDLLKALHYLRRAWTSVKPETLKNCFRKADFVMYEQPVEQEPEDDDELDTLWTELQALGEVEGIDLQDYLAVDQELVTDGALTLAEIAEACSRTEVNDANEESETDVVEIDEEEPESPAITTQEAKDAIQILQQYVQRNFADHAVLRMCDKIDDLLAEERLKKMKQKKITNYFSKL